MKTTDVQKLYSEFILPTYTQMPVCIVKGKGSRVWDLEGREYLDFFPGWGVSALGHCPPPVMNAIKRQARTLIHIPNNFLNMKQAELASVISKASYPARVFFCNSGAEANEGAIKFAKKYGSETGRHEIITMKRSFHGRTLAAMTATGQEKFHHGFEPLMEKFLYADFNDLDSVKRLITPRTVAIMLEPIQGEGGIHVAKPEFMEGLRKLCDEKDMLLILDEVQTGMGRTGKMFAYQHYHGIEPDILTLSKALGGGVPIGAFVVNRKIRKEVLSAGMHGSTFGGSPLVCAASLAVFKTIRKEKLLAHAVKMGKLLMAELEKMRKKYPVIEETRGRALMVALKLKEPSAPYAQEARAQGLLVNSTQGDVLRLLPALTVSAKEIRKAMGILNRVFEKLSRNKEG
ncbi:MAG: Acetylornithine aminotransferase [Candidatus Omnitrophica bacterium ADurb.Bin292]|jgi:predicted acetylornithine/succinylornithine family transaminase|nr:MAG: Acetylornithine aminotransferase [Candidatus Omnitrophica bacterium ADurb.Bin292]HOG24203.1 aspartate aminotransferase family protein [Candidatus Omnitrophota bacterium]HPW76663.1 aspartate aminotransferase family protein [Candidatus Omnitrophota bacterium]HQB11645.1 aspartate aminotransferase family protein [Candidatus Omnitrophota bacterium]